MTNANQSQLARPPKGFGKGPVYAGYLIVGAGIVAGSWGVTQIVADDDGFVAQATVESTPTPSVEPKGSSPAPSPKTVTLPDADGDGVPDEFDQDAEDSDQVTPKEETPSAVDPEPGTSEPQPHQDESEGGSVPEPEPEAVTYVIEQGDTLSQISGETGVPLDILVEVNGIKNPNLIYAGASLIIPPVG